MSGKRITRRRFLASIGAIGGMAALAAACGPTPTPKVVEKVVTQVVKEMVKETVVVEKAVTKEVIKEVPAKAKKVVIQVQTYGGSGGMKHREFSGRVAKYNPNIEVKHVETVYGEIERKTEMGFATGDLPDVLYGASRWHWIGVYKGFYRPLDDLLKTGVVHDYGDFYETVVENEKWEGKTTCIPDRFHTGGNILLTWNRNLLQQFGVKPPEPGFSMMDLKGAALMCTDKQKSVFGVALSPGLAQTYRTESVTRAWGKPSYGANGDTSGWIVQPGGKTFTWYKHPGPTAFYNDWLRPLLDARSYPLAADEVEGGLFVAGRIAFQAGLAPDPRGYALRIAGKWAYHIQDTMLLPVGPEGRQATSHFGNMFMVASICKYPEEALRVIDAMTSTEAGIWDILEIGGTPIARHSVLIHPKVLEVHPALKIIDKLAGTKGAVEPYPMPWNLRSAELDDIFRNTVDPLYLRTKAWEEQAPTVQKECQKLLDQPRP